MTGPKIIEGPTTPIIFFDQISNQGFVNGVGNIVLVCSRFRNDGTGQIISEIAVVAELRATISGLMALREAANAALLLATGKPGEETAN